jgi:hypothetical protein
MKNKIKIGDIIFIVAWVALVLCTVTQKGVQDYYKYIIWGLSPIVVIYYIVKIFRGRKHD